MPLETAAGIWDLNSANPAHTDELAQSDAHARLIKSAILATFPNIQDTVDVDDVVLNDLANRLFQFADGAVGAPSVQVGETGVQGLYKHSTNHLGIAGRLVGDGAVSVGAVEMFLKAPAGLITNGDSGGTHLELNGGVYLNVDYPDLATHLGQGGSSFTLADMYTDGRFPRSRTAATAVGATQASQNKGHTHTVSGTAANGGGHNHAAGSVVTDDGHSHIMFTTTDAGNLGPPNITTRAISQVGGLSGGDGAYQIQSNNTGTYDSGKTQTVEAGITVATTNVAADDHTHTVSGTAATDGGTEARPEALSFIFAIKT